MTRPNYFLRMQPAIVMLAALLCAATLFCANTSFAATGKTVHAFESLAHGANPQSNVISDSVGNLYGTTYFGGAHDLGELFELSPGANGKYAQTILYSFAGGSDGSFPWAGLTFDSAGNLYGTTAGGGTSTVCYGGCGTVFKLSPKSGGGWTETVLFTFTGSTTGNTPLAGVIFDSAGNLYGAASGDYGIFGAGVVFELSPATPTWTETILYTFPGGSFGTFPTTTPVFDSAGNLYGTAVGYTQSGQVYKLAPGASGWTESTIQTFGGGPLTDLIIDSAGNLYGTTSDNVLCGQWDDTVFELSPSAGSTWTAKTLYCFGSSSNDGVVSRGTIAFDSSGNLYGSTFEGGTMGFGTVYQLIPKATGRWTEHVIKNFTNGADGAQPEGGVAFDPAGNLYATAYSGSSAACLYSNYGNPGCGTVIKLTPRVGGPWPSTTISNFGSTDTSFPMGGLIADSSGNYYGTGTQGGAHAAGEVFRLSPKAGGGWTKTALYDFTGLNGDGLYPSGNLVFDTAGNLYGTTELGGDNTDYCNNFYFGCGIAYELSPTASGPWKETVLFTFSSAVGGYPTAGLAFDHAGNLYGTTLQGGPGNCFLFTSGCGSVFQLSPGAGGTWTEHTIYQFTGNNDGGNSYFPVAVDSAGNLYGTTSTGGIYFYSGTAFKLSPGSGGSWTFSVLHNFGGMNGDVTYPLSGVVLDSSGNLYGTGYGPNGTSDTGMVFELSPAAGEWTTTVVHGFTGKDGSSPYGGVVFDSAGNLYGTTASGGKSTNCQGGCGTVFSLAPSSSGWTETVLYSFTSAGDGSTPMSGATVDSAGHIFTTTTKAGGGHQGTVFEVSP